MTRRYYLKSVRSSSYYIFVVIDEITVASCFRLTQVNLRPVRDVCPTAKDGAPG